MPDLEIWKPITDYEGYYEISSNGRIRNIKRNLIMKPFYYKKWNYWRIELRKDGKRELFTLPYILHDHFPEIFDLPKVRSFEDEEWRPVIGYVGEYHVSNYGRIKSVNEKRRGENLLKCTLNPYGYLTVQLFMNDGKKHTRFVHRLIAIAFLEKSKDKNWVNHKIGNKKKNEAVNLEWCTPKENSDHAWANGLTDNRGERNGMAKITESEAILIKYKLKTLPQNEIAAIFNIGISSVQAIQNNKRWAHI